MNLRRQPQHQPQTGSVDADMLQRIIEMHAEIRQLVEHVADLVGVNRGLHRQLAAVNREINELKQLNHKLVVALRHEP